jgi:hypothetical protein
MNYVFNLYPIISGFPTLLVIIEFFYFINHDKRLLRSGKIVLELMTLVVPLILLRVFEITLGLKVGAAFFDPAYGYFIYILIILCQLAYFYCSYRSRIGSPLLEVLINCLLLIGIILNLMIAIQLASLPGILAICMPAAMLFILMLVHNHRLLVYTLEDVDADLLEPAKQGRFSRTCCYLLQMTPVGKTLMLLTLCIPILVLLTKLMLLSAGQSINH